MKTESIRIVYEQLTRGSQITIDSRQIGKGDIFIALKGDKFDGNQFAQKALNDGASIAVVDNSDYAMGDNIILVDNALMFLHELASFHRLQLNIPIIGLTGSNGKTTTKELIRVALSPKFNVFATKGNLNNHIGVPLSLLSVTNKHQIAVIEMGANHVGEIEALCSIVKPTHGLITNIGRAHLDGFGSFEGVIEAKTELYKFFQQNHGTVFYNASNKILTDKVFQFRLPQNSIQYGIALNNAKASIGCDSCITATFSFNGNKISIKTNLTGIYNLENVLVAYTIAKCFDVPDNDIVKSIESYVPSNSRSQLIEKGSNVIVLDAYNANPSSMEAALRSFAEVLAKKPKVVVVGNMLELGSYTEEEHEKVVDLCLHFKFGKIFLVGDNYPKNRKGTIWFPSVILCAEYIKANPLKNSMILLKGSRGAKMEELLDAL